MEKQINVDEIVRNNSDDKNEKIVIELELVKSTIEFIVNEKQNTTLTPVNFENLMRQHFTAFSEKYVGIFHKIMNDDNIDIIYEMINAQIEVAKKNVSYSSVANQFGNILHKKYVEHLV